jgi:hypothetical protein
MCHLVFKQGLHTWNTCPLLIILFRLENFAKKQYAGVQAYPMDENTIAMLNALNNALIGEFNFSASCGTHHMGANLI